MLQRNLAYRTSGLISSSHVKSGLSSPSTQHTSTFFRGVRRCGCRNLSKQFSTTLLRCLMREHSVDKLRLISIRIRTGGLRMMESPRQFLMTSIIMIGMVIVIGYFL